MEKIIRQLPDDFAIDRDLVIEMIKQTSTELTQSKASYPCLHCVLIHTHEPHYGIINQSINQ